MTIAELYQRAQDDWSKKNIDFLGIGLVDEKNSIESIQYSLDYYCGLYWNSSQNKCFVARMLDDETRGLDKDCTKKIPHTYSLQINPNNMCIDVYAIYQKNDKQVPKKLKLASLPTPTTRLSWIINRAHYTPKIIAKKNKRIIQNFSDTIVGKGWKYIKDQDKFIWAENEIPESEIISGLTSYSKILLESVLGEPVTVDNIKYAMKNLPFFSNNSIFRYEFDHFDRFYQLVEKTNKYAQPLSGRLFGLNMMMIGKSEINKLEDFQLIRTTSEIDALTTYKTVENVFISDGKDHIPMFQYTDTIGFFDAFKTATTKNAGRQRMLLDNVFVKNGLLYIQEDNSQEKVMFDYIKIKPKQTISTLSKAPFCHNNKPKRIMMNAKMKSQAIPLKGEVCHLTHQITARVGFAEIEGYNLADSIVISESFAKRLRSIQEDIIYCNPNDIQFKKIEYMYEKDTFDYEYLKYLYPIKNPAILETYENVQILHIEYVDVLNARVFIKYETPFMLGDKLTNLHGAKGTVGLILPDDKMPTLKHNIGLMEKGPLEVIFSGYSVAKRGSYGQVFEAFVNATQLEIQPGEDYISKIVPKYSELMKDYSDWSIVEFNGQENKIPVGIIHVMRLHHHATTHLTISNTKRPLKLGEMEKFNLVANDCDNILKELALRDPKRYYNHKQNNDFMQKSGELPLHPKMRHEFIEMMKLFNLQTKIY